MSSSSSSSSGAKKRDASALATPEETEHDLPDKAERTAMVNARLSAEVAGPARWECPICMSDKSMLGVSSAACAVPHYMCIGCVLKIEHASAPAAPMCPVCRVPFRMGRTGRVSLSRDILNSCGNASLFNWLASANTPPDHVKGLTELENKHLSLILNHAVLGLCHPVQRRDVAIDIPAFMMRYEHRIRGPAYDTLRVLFATARHVATGDYTIRLLHPLFSGMMGSMIRGEVHIAERNVTEIVYVSSAKMDVVAILSDVFTPCNKTADHILSGVSSQYNRKRMRGVILYDSKIETVCGQVINGAQYYVNSRASDGWSPAQIASVIGEENYALVMESFDTVADDETLFKCFARISANDDGRRDINEMCLNHGIVSSKSVNQVIMSLATARDCRLTHAQLSDMFDKRLLDRAIPLLCDTNRFGRQVRRCVDGGLELCVTPPHINYSAGTFAYTNGMPVQALLRK